MDPYFDKPATPPQPRRPLVSTGTVVWLCLTVMFCAFLWFAHVEPKMAKDLATGLAVAVVAIILFLKM